MVLLILMLSVICPTICTVQGQGEFLVSFNNPSGGESWTGGHMNNITWNLSVPAHVDPTDVDITLEYVYDGKGPYPIAQLTGDTTNYTWIPPFINSRNVWLIIKAERAELRSFDLITMTVDSSPPVLKDYFPGQGDTIPSTAGIELLFDQEVKVDDISANFTFYHGPFVVEGSFQAKMIGANYSVSFHPVVRLVPGTDYRWTLEGGVRDVSYPGNVLILDHDIEFRVEEGPPEITVISPVKDTVARVGELLEIRWVTEEAVLDDNPVNISYSANGGLTWINIVRGIPDTGIYEWSVQKAPLLTYPIMNAMIMVSCRSISGYEDHAYSNTFKIYENFPPEVTVIRPYTGSYLVKNHNYNILWTAEDDEPLPNRPITISVTWDDGETWKVIAQSIRNTGSYNWYVEGIPAGTTIINVSCTDSQGAMSWAHSPAFTVLAQNPLSLKVSPGNHSFNSRDRVNISWEVPAWVPGTQKFRLLYSADGVNWVNYRELDPKANFTIVHVPYEISSDFRFRLEMYDWEEILFYADSREFEVFPEILGVDVEYVDDFTFVTIRFNGYVSLWHMQHAFTLYRNGVKVEVTRNDIYSSHSSIIVFIGHDLEPGVYSVELNSEGVENRDFTTRDLTSFTIPYGSRREYWIMLLLIPLAVVLLYMYRGKGKEAKKVPGTNVRIHR